MSSVPAQDPALKLAIAFVNTYDLLEDPPDRLSAARAAHITRFYGFVDLAESLAGLSNRDVDRLRTVRSGLYAIFAAPDPAATVAAVNAALDDAHVKPRVVLDDGGQVRLTAALESPGDDPAAALSALVVDALAHALTVGGPDRFGTCAGDPCRCVYIDRTRAGRQRFCCQLCNDRMAAAAYRSRRSTLS